MRIASRADATGMSWAALLTLALGIALALRRPRESAVIGGALLCLVTGYGVWASFFGALFGLPVFLLGMGALVGVALACAAIGLATRRSALRISWLLGFLRMLSGSLLLYSVGPLAFLVWFLSRLPDHVEAPVISPLGYPEEFPTSLPPVLKKIKRPWATLVHDDAWGNPRG